MARLPFWLFSWYIALKAMKNFQSFSSRETAELGERLAKQLANQFAAGIGHGATVVALQGDLGAGKTTFTQGFARGLGIKRRMASPTFIIMRRFPVGKRRDFYHLDAYRIKTTDSLEVFGADEIFKDPKNIVLVEWPEKIKKILPKKTLWLKFRYGKKENERIISGSGIIGLGVKVTKK